MKEPTLKNEFGFTIVELLMVVAILGLIMGAVYSLFSVHRNAAYSQVEVVEEQQNLRIAMDCIARDLRIAGIMMSLGTNPIPAATGSPAFPTYTNDIRINVASAEGRFARVATQHAVGATETVIDLTVESPATASSPNIVDGFALNDKVRIIRPVSSIQPLTPSPANTPFVVTAVDRAAHTISIERQDSTPFTTSETVVAGDMIAKVSGATYPETIDYYLVNAGTTVNGTTCPNNERCLVRQVNAAATPAGTADIIATKLSTLTFGYLDDSYTEVSAPSASALDSIRAVRVSMRGTTAATAGLWGGGRSREITSIIKLRNRR